MLDDFGRQRVQGGELLQHVLVGAGAGLCPFQNGKLELVEENAAKLDGRVDIEFRARFSVDFADKLGRAAPTTRRFAA